MGKTSDAGLTSKQKGKELFKKKDFEKGYIEHLAEKRAISNSMVLKYLNLLKPVFVAVEDCLIDGGDYIYLLDKGIVIFEEFCEKKREGIERNKDALIAILVDLLQNTVPLDLYKQAVKEQDMLLERHDEAKLRIHDLAKENLDLEEKVKILENDSNRAHKENDKFSNFIHLQRAVISGFEKTIQSMLNSV